MTKYVAHKRTSDDICQSLATHLSETAEIASYFATKIGLADIGRVLGLLHDFGKYSAEFQNYIKSATNLVNQDEEEYVDAKLLKGKIDHSSAGAQYAYQALYEIGGVGQGKLCAQIIALCIASHHSGLIDCLSVDPEKGDVFKKRIDKDDNKTHLRECVENADLEIKKEAELLLTSQLVEQFMVVAKKVLKDPSVAFDIIPGIQLGLLTRFLFSCLIDADRLNSAEFEQPDKLLDRLSRSKAPNWNQAIQRLEAKLGSLDTHKPIDIIRQNISNQCLQRSSEKTGIYTLSVPTGGGKTYASLRYALHHAQANKMERIFYIIPFTSIIEQNANVMREALEREEDLHPWILEHHSNIEPENQTWHSKLASENWDAPIVITTMVQFLETLFSGGTSSVRRLHQLANSVLVFDEIQTLPVNCTHLFCNALNFLTTHASSSVLLCTATQPLLNQLKSPQKGQLDIPPSNELIKNVSQLFKDLQRVKIENHCKPKGWCLDEVAELSLQQFHQKGSCLIIVNTKDWAVNLYQACAKQVDADAIFHLSTNQYPAHRKQLLSLIRQRLEDHLPVLCISTQLIEAGVDVDFAAVIRFLAGLDSIAQAAGRCNRNGLLKCSTVYVVNPEKENTQKLRDIEIGKEKTVRIFSESFEDWLAPDAIQRYFKYYFFDRGDEMDYQCKDSQGKPNTLMNLLSHQHIGLMKNTLSRADIRKQEKKLPLLQQAFMEAGKFFKAIDAPTQALIIEHGEGKGLVTELCAVAKQFDPALYYSLLKQAQKYSVNVFPNVWQKLQEADAIAEVQEGEGIFYLKQEFYSEAFGLSVEPVAPQSINIV